MSALLVIFFVGFGIRAFAENASATNKSTMNDCQDRPVDMKSVKYCCDVPKPKLEFFQAQCHYPQVQRRAEADLFCFFECIGNISNAIDNLELNLTAVNELLKHVYSEKEFIDGFSKSFEDCSAFLKSKVTVFKRVLNTGVKKPSRCSPVSLLYTMCAYLKLLKHCPKSLWHNNKSCEISRAYVENCEDALLELASVRKKKNMKPKL